MPAPLTAHCLLAISLGLMVCGHLAHASEPPGTDATLSATSERIYDGHTLSEWRERIQTLRFDDPAAAEAVPGLIALMQDETLPWFTRRQAALTLGRIGQPAKRAVPVLIELLQTIGTEEESPAQWSAKALALFGPVAAPATSALIDVLEDEHRSHFDRLTTIEALARIGGAHAEAIPALIRMAQSDPGQDREAAELREAAVESLSLVGPPAAPAVPILLRLTQEPEGRLRKKAIVSLQAIGPSASVAAPTLAELVIFDELSEVREAAGLALSKLGPSGEATLEHLITDRVVGVRARAALALGQIPSVNDAALASLQRALNDAEAEVRIAAAESLWKLTSSGSPLLTAILDAMTLEDRQLRIRGYRLLLELGDEAREAIPRLERMSRDSRPHVQDVALKALAQLRENDTLRRP